MKNINSTYLLILGFLILILLSYRFAVSKTLESRVYLNNIQTQEIQFSNIPSQLKQLRIQNNYYDSILTVKKINRLDGFETNLLNKITTISKRLDLEITKFNEPHTVNIENSEIKTFNLSVIGAYSSVLDLIYQLEQHYKLGKVMSVDFKKKKHRKTYKEYLECTMYLQNTSTSNSYLK